jgi:hypothetical protein
MHGPRPIVLVTTHNGYASCTEDCPFWVDVMPTLPIVAIFSHLFIRAGPLLPERVMVQAVGHWSNTTSLRAQERSNWRN